MFQHMGEYVKTSDKYGGEFYTFTPAPLCKNFSMDVDGELLALLTTAHKLLGVLEGMAMCLPDADSVQELMRLKECFCSLSIDGKANQSFRDILKIIPSENERFGLIANLIAASKYSDGNGVMEPVMSKIYSIIQHGAATGHKAGIRKKAITLDNVITNLKTYSPTAPELIMPALYDMTRFVNMENHTDTLIKAAMAHYQFEMIHPYENYNGIIGRILIQMILSNAGYVAAQYVCLSECLYIYKEAYFDKLSSAQSGSGYLPWVKFFAQSICYASERAISAVRQYIEVISEDERRIAALSQSSKFAVPVYNYFKKYLVSEIIPISTQLGISYNTAAKVVKALAEASILTLEQEQSRHKVYCHGALAIFEL